MVNVIRRDVKLIDLVLGTYLILSLTKSSKLLFSHSLMTFMKLRPLVSEEDFKGRLIGIDPTRRALCFEEHPQIGQFESEPYSRLLHSAIWQIMNNAAIEM
jgi:hypothetical protein